MERHQIACCCLLLLLFVTGVNGFRNAVVVEESKIMLGRGRRRTSSASPLLLQQQAAAAQQQQQLPELVVLDLDNTVWTPELYQLRKHQRNNQIPVAGKDVQLMKGAQQLFDAKRSGHRRELQNVRLAAASRTKSVEWAHSLLDQFGIRDLFDYIEIFPSHKITHFQNIQSASGIAYHRMLFFDDARDGKYGNCVPVAQELGVLSVHCPKGLNETHIFETGMQRFAEWNGQPGTIVEWDGSVTTTINSTDDDIVDGTAPSERRLKGQIKFVNQEKRFGFIRYGGRNTKDLFFHFSSLSDASTSAIVSEGDRVSFGIGRDPKNGKNRATNVEIVSTKTSSSEPSTGTSSNTVTMRAFSMNMPFAALLANGYKNLETRNGTMFVPYPEGTQMLLHVGRRTYPDGDRHIEVIKSGDGLSDNEIEKLKSLPAGFGRGMVVAICEIGKTYETTVEERSDPETQRRVCAFGVDSGKMVTEIKRVAYLKRPIKVAAQGGVFKVEIDPQILPDGWSIPSTERNQMNGQTNAPAGTLKSGIPIYSVSG